MQLTEKEFNDIIQLVENVTSKALEEAYQIAAGKYGDLIQENILPEETIYQIEEVASELVTEYVSNIVASIFETINRNPEYLNETFANENFYLYLKDIVESYAIGVMDTLFYELSLSPQLKEKMKKALKWGAIGAGILGAGAAAAAALSNPEHTKQVAGELADKARDVAHDIADKTKEGIEAIKDKVMNMLHGGAQQTPQNVVDNIADKATNTTQNVPNLNPLHGIDPTKIK